MRNPSRDFFAEHTWMLGLTGLRPPDKPVVFTEFRAYTIAGVYNTPPEMWTEKVSEGAFTRDRRPKMAEHVLRWGRAGLSMSRDWFRGC